ncbi:endonuclease [Mycoplasma marinum]|uniref:Uncharacterized protein n=1 Tax=Mycoplasma marinum TaxID=1937190 RepID=A0A4R0XVJ8_9MOLU|nr:endonuclease [Mycoplasma marinum]TCG11873.1 hypothetical protein C4B24_00560 [Mycoplasma marinum]
MKINKKYLLSLGATFAIVSMPIFSAVSCGKTKDLQGGNTKKDSVKIDDKKTKKTAIFTNEEIEKILNDRFTTKIIRATKEGAIAKTTGKYTNYVFPVGYTGKKDSHDIILETQEAEDIIKKSLKENNSAYIGSSDAIKEVKGISAKAYLKLSRYQYYAIASYALEKDENTQTEKTPQDSGTITITPKKVGNITYNKSNNYYMEANNLKGKKLFAKLHEIQGQHLNKIKGGSSGYGELYNTYKTAFKDNIFEHDNTVIDIYSENPNGSDPYNYIIGNNGRSYKHEGDMYNREHLIPQSWFDKKTPMRNDAQFVWPSDGKVNGVRSNYPHAPVLSASWTSKNHSKLGTNPKYGGTVFEPIDRFKGDIARSYLYFALTYYQSIDKTKGGANIFSNSFPYMKDNFLKLYIKWAKEDPVDEFDIQRNNGVSKAQGNRNPFIDYPGLIDNIWGSKGTGNASKSFENNGIAISIN